MRFGASENPRMAHEKVHHALRITVWVSISSHGLLGPNFFEKTVNSERYLSTLCNAFMSHFVATGLRLHTQAAYMECCFGLSA
jgi:hypothetical protein